MTVTLQCVCGRRELWRWPAGEPIGHATCSECGGEMHEPAAARSNADVAYEASE